MKLESTDVHDVKVLTPKVFTDERGYFTETFREELLLNEANTHFVQENESFSKKGILRGLHYQKEPFAQAKLVRCVVGEIWDVAVDLRKNSSTFKKYIYKVLSGENKEQLFIPKGFAHGFLVLSDWAIVTYKVDNYYNNASEVTINFDDKDLGIEWPLPNNSLVLSEKDRKGITLNQAHLF